MAIAANQRILTLDLWKLASEIKEGDYVFNSDGKLVKVKLVQPYVANECYEVKFDDHVTVCGDTHLAFMLETDKYRSRLKQYKGVHKFRRPLRRYSVIDIIDSGENLSTPTTKPLQFPNQGLPVPPFLLGFWFFAKRYNGTMVPPAGHSELVHQKFKDAGYKLTFHKRRSHGEYEFRCHPSIESQMAPFVPKKIPANYLYASVEQRIELLSGILYGKRRQYSVKNDEFIFNTLDKEIHGQVRFLVESIGSKTFSLVIKDSNRIRMNFKTRIRLIDTQVSKPLKIHYGRRYIPEIRQISSQSCVHIETDDANNTILVGEGFIPIC
jgi:hypothetical protein